MSKALCVVPVEKLCDRAIAESHGFSVRSYVPRERGLRVIRPGQASDVVFYFVGPAGDFGPDVTSELVAWSMAAYLAKIRADVWGAWCRARRVSAVTVNFVPLDERPIFGHSEDEVTLDVALDAAKIASDAVAAKKAEQVARSLRLADVKIQIEVTAKGLPAGREETLAFLKKLLEPKKTTD